jgi:Ca2+-binding RTX toxin-like protein
LPTCQSARVRRLSAHALAIAFVATTFAAAPSSAATIGISGATLIAGADPLEQFTLTASIVGTDLLLVGTPLEIVTPGCTLDAIDRVRCALAGFASVTLIGGDLDDLFDLTAIGALEVFVAAKGGDDVLLGGDGPEILSGGPGDDVFVGGSILNIIFTGDGADVVIGGRRSFDDPPPDPTPLPSPTVPEPGLLLLAGSAFGAGVVQRRAHLLRLKK